MWTRRVVKLARAGQRAGPRGGLLGGRKSFGGTRPFSSVKPQLKLDFTNYLVGGGLFGVGLLIGTVQFGGVKNGREAIELVELNQLNQLNELLDKSTSSVDEVSAPKYADQQEFQRALSQIVAIVGKENTSFEKEVIDSFSDSFFNTHHPPDPENQRPHAVIYPRSTEQVSQIMKIAHKYRVPVVANSGLTSLEGQNMHTRGPYSISLSFSEMDKIILINPVDLDAVVQPGVDWHGLDEELQSNDKTKHLLFGPDPGVGAKIGGMVGTSCSGTNAYRYGTMKENIVNLTVVLADGTIIKTKQRPRKSSAGYDLTRLFVGAEGTLGIITEATIKLHVRPKHEFVTVASFPTIKDATAAAQSIIQNGVQVNAIELLNSTMVLFVNNYAGILDDKGNPKTFTESPTLLFKIGGSSNKAIDEQIHLVQQYAKQNNLIKFERSNNEEENAILWSARRNGLWSTIEYGKQVLPDPNDVQTWTTDIAVPISSLTKVIAETNDDLNNSGFQNLFSVMGHIGDGNCHFLILYNSADYHKTQKVVDRMVYRALQNDGTCTGEHGVGVGKRRYLPVELGPSSVDLMRHIKLLLDPRCILNPDKVFAIDKTDDLDQQFDGGAIKEHVPACCH